MKPCIGCAAETDGLCGCGAALCHSCWHTRGALRRAVPTDPVEERLAPHVACGFASWDREDDAEFDSYIATLPATGDYACHSCKATHATPPHGPPEDCFLYYDGCNCACAAYYAKTPCRCGRYSLNDAPDTHTFSACP